MSRRAKMVTVDEARRYVDAFNAADVAALSALMAPGYRYTDRYAGGTLDAERHLAVIADVHARMPDRRISVEHVVTAARSQIVEGEWSATTPTGVTLRTHVVIVFDVAEGLIVEGRAYYREADLAAP